MTDVEAKAAFAALTNANVASSLVMALGVEREKMIEAFMSCDVTRPEVVAEIRGAIRFCQGLRMEIVNAPQDYARMVDEKVKKSRLEQEKRDRMKAGETKFLPDEKEEK